MDYLSMVPIILAVVGVLIVGALIVDAAAAALAAAACLPGWALDRLRQRRRRW